MTLGRVFKPLKPQAQSAGSANRHSAWGYTIKACLRRLKALIFVVRLIADLVRVAAPCAGDGEARKHALV